MSDFTIERNDRFTARATSTRAVAIIEESFTEKTDEWIAAELNRLGLRTGAGLPWTPQRVRRVRYEHEWFRSARKSRRATTQDEEELYTAHAIAVRIGVKPSIVMDWFRKGKITPAKLGGPGRSYRFKLDPATLARLIEEKQKMEARRTAASAGVPRAESR